MTNTEWMAKAHCRSGDTDWTNERTPRPATRDRLAAICADCPVIARCAAYALDTEAEMGMYAGVWIPQQGVVPRNPTHNWRTARQQLKQRAKEA
jgi:hypothetical protein